jgi:hemerythrin-like domain-containing protein
MDSQVRGVVPAHPVECALLLGRSTMSTLTECLEEDHRRLDAILTECKSLATAGGFAAAAERFESFASGLSRHIDAEEGVLFPPLLERAQSAMGPVRVMRGEHLQIRALVLTLQTALRNSNPFWRSAVGELEALLDVHNMKEERVLYPMADAVAATAPGSEALRTRLVCFLAGATAL